MKQFQGLGWAAIFDTIEHPSRCRYTKGMLRRRLLVSYKIFFGLLGFSALVSEIAVLAERGKFEPTNFFSFFTVQTNSLVCLVFLLSALLTTPKPPRWLSTLRAAATVYILIVGIGFAALLSGLEGVALTAVPWDNIVLHYIIPVAVLLDYLFDRPTLAAGLGRKLWWLLFPIIYAAYSLIRGAATGWYPYPFLNPSANGYASLVLPIAGLVVLGVILVWGVDSLSKRPVPSTAKRPGKR